MAIVLGPIGHVLSLLFPKDDRLWLFGAWFGHQYSDNPRCLYEHVLGHHPDVQAIWITKDESIESELRARGLPVARAYSLEGLWHQIRARVFVCSTGAIDFTPWLMTRRSVVVQLWHGTPGKKILLARLDRWSIPWIVWKLRSWLTDNYAIIVSPDEASDEIYMERFGLPADRLLRAGLPRWDSLAATPSQRRAIRDSLGVGERALWYYLPTHREGGRIVPSPNVAVARELVARSAELRQLGIHLVIKPHFYERDQFASVRGTEDVSVLLDLPDDTSRCLAAADGIITDYSSVAFDCYRLGMPVLLFPYDYDDYVGRGGSIDPSYFSSAPSARTLPELMDALGQSNGTNGTNGTNGRGSVAARAPLPAHRHCQAVVEAIGRRVGAVELSRGS